MVKYIYSKFDVFFGYVNVYKIFAFCSIAFIFLSNVFWQVYAEDLKGIDVVSDNKKTTPAVEISVVLEKQDWIYDMGEKAFLIVKAYKNGTACDNEKIQFQIALEKMQLTKRGEIGIKGGEALISGDTTQKPGFLRCDVKTDIDGHAYRARTTTKFAPEEIKLRAKQAKDFTAFWYTAIQKSKSILLHKKLTLLEHRATEQVIDNRDSFYEHNVLLGYTRALNLIWIVDISWRVLPFYGPQ